MTTYNSYEEAKIANPEMEVYKLAAGFIATNEPQGVSVHKCNPADDCMTVEKFLADGHKFVEGDLILDEGVTWTVSDKVNSDTYIYTVKSSNKPDIDDNERYILRAAALEEKKPRTKVEWVKVKYSTAWQAAKDHEERAEFLYRQSDLSDAIKGNNWKAIQSPSEAAQYHFDLYRRIETPITEREVFIETVKETLRCGYCDDDIGKLYDSGKFKLVEGE